MTNQFARVERDIEGKTLILETGRMAKQAHGACLVTMGETVVLSTVCQGPVKDLPFFPMTVDYRERTAAAGKIPGGFFKREGRPTLKEVITMRMTDRSVRPFWPKGYKNDTMIQSIVFSADNEADPDVLSMIGAFAAIEVSGLPFEGTMGGCRIGFRDGKPVAFPTIEDLKAEENLVNLVLSGTEDAIAMVECQADELGEEDMISCLEHGHEVARQIVGMAKELAEKAGTVRQEWEAPEVAHPLDGQDDAIKARLKEALSTKGKHAMDAAVGAVKDSLWEDQGVANDDAGFKAAKEAFGNDFKALEKSAIREMVLSGTRIDGRKSDEIRDITGEVGLLPRTHGSALFTRGETQAMVTITFGTTRDEAIIDGLEDEVRLKFLLHYNFPPFSVGEVRMIRGTSRREYGHGNLADRAVQAQLPDPEDFPYTVRAVSDILESNGSSSMATVCGTILALMDAGVPIKQPVAGIAMGLVKEGDDYAVLSDILGTEDHVGDMDFKVTGTQRGITALQMDMKVQGLDRAILAKALDQAREGRLHILRCMMDILAEPRTEMSKYAPRIEAIKIPSEKIGLLIGPKGANIREMQEKYEVVIEVIDDDGNVQVSSPDGTKISLCVAAIEAMCEEAEVGKDYTGTVTGVKPFGAFIEILPGQEGLLHVSDLSDDYISEATEAVSRGDELEVTVVNIDPSGKIKLGRKGAEPQPGGGGGGGRDRGDRGRRDEAPRADVIRIYVGNLSYDTGEETLTRVFGEFGKVHSVFLPTERETGRLRGFGFVEMDSADGPKAIEALDETELDGRNLTVNEAKERPARAGGRR